MTQRLDFHGLAIEAELHALALRDLYRRSSQGVIKRTTIQIDQYGTRLERAEAIVDILNKIMPREAEFRAFLQGEAVPRPEA